MSDEKKIIYDGPHYYVEIIPQTSLWTVMTSTHTVNGMSVNLRGKDGMRNDSVKWVPFKSLITRASFDDRLKNAIENLIERAKKYDQIMIQRNAEDECRIKCVFDKINKITSKERWDNLEPWDNDRIS